MKKTLIIMISLIVMACWLPACNKQPAEKSEDLLEKQTSKILNDATAPFKIATAVYSTDGCGNEDGFYSMKRNNEVDPEDQSSNILYIDYATKKQVYLCAQPSCTHDNESCTSWIAPREGGAPVLALAGDKLLILYNSPRPHIDITELNGANRKTLCTFDDGISLGWTVAYNGQYLVLSLDQYSNDEPGQIKNIQTLCAIDVNTGEQITVYSHESETANYQMVGFSRLYFSGVTNTGFIMKTETIGEYEIDDNPDITYENMDEATRYEVFEIPFNGSEIKPLISYTGDVRWAVMPIGQYLYFTQSSNDTITLNKMDTKTGDTSVIVNFAETEIDLAPETHSDSIIISPICVDNKLIISYHVPYITEERIYKTYSIDTNTGEMQEMTLSLHYYMTQYPVRILADAGDKLLIHAKAQEIDDGRAMPYIKITLALISKQDCLASNPNYEYIDMV